MYARLLASMSFLHTVTIECPFYTGATPLQPFANRIQWTGECDWCMVNIQDDPEFIASWVNKKRNARGDSIPPQRPPSLRLVIWNLKSISDPSAEFVGFPVEDEFSASSGESQSEDELYLFPDTDVVGPCVNFHISSNLRTIYRSVNLIWLSPFLGSTFHWLANRKPFTRFGNRGIIGFAV